MRLNTRLSIPKDKDLETDQISFRVTPEFKKEIIEAAEKEYRGVAGFVKIAIRERLDRSKQSKSSSTS